MLFEYSIVYRKRKTIGISVSPEHGVRISAPNWVSKKQIADLVEQKASWITAKLAELAQRPGKAPLENGMNLPFLGRGILLEIMEDGGKRAKIVFDGQKITAFLPAGLSCEERDAALRKLLQGWYKEQARETVEKRVQIFSRVMGLQPARIAVKQQKSRWGSCSSRGNININWRLVMMPDRVVDYIIVHEMAHLREMNHSKEFWKLVASVLGDYPDRRKLLKEWEKKLNIL